MKNPQAYVYNEFVCEKYLKYFYGMCKVMYNADCGTKFLFSAQSLLLVTLLVPLIILDISSKLNQKTSKTSLAFLYCQCSQVTKNLMKEC